MLIENTLYFDNNGYELKEYSYKLELFNIISLKTTEFEGNVTINSNRIFSITNDFSNLIKGQYRIKLYLDEILVSTNIGNTELSTSDKYIYNEEKEKYIYE